MDADARPEQAQEPVVPTGPSDVDWEGEWRWHDAKWASNGVVFLGICAVPGVSWVWLGPGAGSRIAVGAVVLAVLLIWLNEKLFRRLTAETGLTHRQLAVVMRLSRREEIPRDPVARRAMAHLIRLQNSKRMGGGWMRWFGAALMLAIAVLQLLSGRYVFGAVMLLGAGYVASRFGMVARVQARQDRLEARLAGELAPQPGPPAGPRLH
ncbi:hypothetical protein [Streptomyces sp. NBC_00237]|uniref:hypothetical protein n=1 Tax=Streptomyces sp. NBC_00237 TaxID=2975687 RepID=UPI002253DF0C|nr:hypothetical protein [Streptomyces sp. NBC_00237]